MNVLDMILLAILLLAILSLYTMVSSMQKKLNFMAKKMDSIIDHLGVEDKIAKAIDEEIMVFIDMGKVEAAVKVLRERTGMDLLEAKTYVDRLASK